MTMMMMMTISPQLPGSLHFLCGSFGQPKTRAHVRLLGSCFKTGRIKPYGHQQPWCIVCVDCTQFNPDDSENGTGCQPAKGMHRSPLLELFSKFFSSFPHGTCSLSVSCQYSALDGVYNHFWAAFPSNPTHGKRIVCGPPCHERDCHPLRCAVPSNFGR